MTNEKMAQWVKVPADKLDDQSSIPRTHVVEGGNQLFYVALWPPQTHCGAQAHTHQRT